MNRPSPAANLASVAPRSTNVWAGAWAVVVPAIVIVYLLVHVRFPRVLPAEVSVYLAQPLAWLALALLSGLAWRYGLPSRPRLRWNRLALAALLGAFHIALLLIAGLVGGFGHSPYGRSPGILAANLISVAAMLIGVELARAYLIGLVGRKRPLAGLLLVALLLTLVSIPFARLSRLETPLVLFRTAGEIVLPRLAENLLATMLALLGGPSLSLLYRGMVEGFEWASPILPNLHWAVMALIGTLAPVLGMLVVQSHETPNTESSAPPSVSPAWLVPAFAGVLLIWFNQGLFGVRPTIVSGVSMVPTLQAGDLVLTDEVLPEEIAVGDIVRFASGDSYILHRVIAIRQEGALEFITRGDANNVNDPPIPARVVEGRVVRVLPGLGWPSILVHNGIDGVLGWLRR